MTLVTQCSLLHFRGKNSFLDKINDKLTCTGSLKPSVGWGWAVSLFTRTKSQWNVPRSTCSIFLTYAWVQCLSFVGYMCVWRSVNIELTEKWQRLWLKYVCVISQTTFEIQILPTVTFSLHILIGLLNLKNYMGSCHKDYLRRAFLYVQFVNVPTQVFYDGLLKALFLPLALGLSPEINTMCHSTLEVDSTNSCRKKLIWVQLNQIKPLGFDAQSNTSSWRLFFKLSVSYPCFRPQKSFLTYQQMNCSLRILKTLHIVHVRKSSVDLQWCDASRIRESSVRSRDHRQSYVNYLIPKNHNHSSGWLSPTE